MKSKRYRAILKSDGYKKSGDLYFKRSVCIQCKEAGRQIMCLTCKGTGEFIDVTSLVYERYWDM